jgi:hypothetical protein
MQWWHTLVLEGCEPAKSVTDVFVVQFVLARAGGRQMGR